MIRCVASLSLCVVLCVSCFAGDKEDAKKAEGAVAEPTVAVFLDKALDSNVVIRARAALVSQFPTAMRFEKSVEMGAKKSATALAREYGPKLGKSDLCGVLLVQDVAGQTKKASVFPAEKIGVVDVGVLATFGHSETNAAEMFLRRVEKESVCAAAELCGVSNCLLPYCAAMDHASEKELDEKARNLCPVCQGRLDKALKAKGVKLPEPVAAGPKEKTVTKTKPATKAKH